MNVIKKTALTSIALIFCLVSSVFPKQIAARDPTIIRGHYQQTIDAFEENFTEAKKSGQRWQEVDVLRNTGIAYQYMGDYQKAIELYRQALAIAIQVEDSGRIDNVLTQMGNTYSQLGDYQGIDFFEEQFQLAQTSGKLDLQRILLGKLGLAYLSNAEYEKAIEAYEQYLPLVQDLDKPLDEIMALNLLASAYGAAGENEQLKAVLKQMLAVAQESGDPQLENLALSQQSSWSHILDENTGAIATQERALQLARETGDVQQELFSLQQIARIRATSGEAEKVISLLEESLEIAKTLDNEFLNKSWQAQSLDYLSRTYSHLGNHQKALDLQSQSLVLYEGLNKLASQDSNISQAAALGHLGELQFQTGKLTAALGTLQEAIAIHTRLRQQVLENANLFAMSRDDLNRNLREGLADISRTRQQVLVAQNLTDEALVVAEESRARAFVDLLTISLEVDYNRNLSAPIPTLNQLQEIAKARNSTLVQYSVIYDGARQSLIKFSQQPPRAIALYMWVIRPTGKVTFRRRDLDSLEKPLQQVISKARCFQRLSCRHKKHLNQLHQVLIDPIADLLPKNPDDRVTFIPQDSLFLVPFPALIDENDKHLIEKHTILTAPSIQVLDLTRQQRERLPENKNRQNLVVGNPTMPSWRSKPGEAPQQLSSLPGAEIEAEAIAKLLETQPLIGDRATEITVVEKMVGAKLIHLATHGLLDDFQGFQSSLAFAPSGKEDGFLTAREIVNLKLTAELVVLSACDTGRGQINGDGVIGLSRSFIATGVPSLVVSLWKVPDDPTAFLMVSFYRNLQQTSDKAKALRRAMLATMEKHPQVVNWAAFTLIGEPE